MIKKYISVVCFSIICLLFFICIFSYSHLNWREDVFLFILICLYPSGRIFRRTTSGIWNNFPIFLLIFLLSQFFINNFHPENLNWWIASRPGWIILLAAFLGSLSLVAYQKMRADDQWPDSSRQTLQELTGKATPGIIVVSVAMFFLFILNVDDFSPQGKFVPDYSIYIIIAFGFVLFYFLNFSLRYVSVKKMEMLLKPSAVGVLILLVGIGATKIYQVYAAYRKAVRVEAFMGKAGTDWKAKWREVLELNRIPGIESISTRATVELAKIKIEQGDFRQASNYYKKILADQAFNFEANQGFAEVAFKQKEWREACEAYKRAIYLRPKEKNLYSAYIHACIKDGKIDKALEFIGNLKEARAIALYDPEDYLIIGNALLKRKKLNEAIVYLQKGKESMPQNYKGYFLLGRAYLESGQYIEGCRVLESALKLNPDIAEGYYYLGIGYERIHQDQKAIEAFEKLVSIDNKDIRGFYHLKGLYAKMGLEDKAIEMGSLIENTATRVIEAADWKGRSGENVYRNGNMYWEGTVSAPLFLKEGEVKFILQARGTPAKGIWPHMAVILDDEIIGEVDVPSTKLKDYEFKKTVKAGKYLLSVSFMNDGGTLDKKGKLIEDRNLFVRGCGIVYDR